MDLTVEDITYVRLLITDTGDDPIFSDQEIQAVAGQDERIKKVAARLLDIMATSELLVSKKIRTQDLSTDGPAVADQLRKQANALRAEDAAEQNPAVVTEAFHPADCDGPELTRFGWFLP